MLENAALNGVEVITDAKVEKIEKLENGYKVILANGEELETRALVNAAGVFADEINNMVSEKKV